MIMMLLMMICRIRYFVLDEADKACDIEMENQIRTVCFSIIELVELVERILIFISRLQINFLLIVKLS